MGACSAVAVGEADGPRVQVGASSRDLPVSVNVDDARRLLRVGPDGSVTDRKRRDRPGPTALGGSGTLAAVTLLRSMA